MRGSTAIWRLRVALAAAFLLLFETISGAFAGADLSARMALDAYGNPICASHAGPSHAGHDGGSGQSGLPGCCTLACSMAAPAIADAEAGGDVGPGPGTVIARLPAGFAPGVVAAASGHDPGRPRAPPRA